MIAMDRPEIAFALNAVRQATTVAQRIQQELAPAALTKKDRSPVTVADYAVQALIGCMLEGAFPDAVLVAEEDSAKLRSPGAEEVLRQVTHYVSQRVPHATTEAVCTWIDRGAGECGNRFWCLDPIDGTKGFLRSDQYAVAFALLEDHSVQVAVLGCPNLSGGCRPEPGGPGSIVVAARGEGAWVGPVAEGERFVPLRVSSIASASQTRLLRSFESGHTNVSQIDRLVEVMGVRADPVLMDSQAKYAVLAAGAGDLLVRLLSPDQPDYREKIWDQAAGSLVVEEAGGRITDLRGESLDFSQGRTLAANRGVLASNGHLHQAALDAVEGVGAV